jgi:tetratricopeptide (TPR) repeat protein
MCRFFNIFLYVCSCYGWRFEIGRVKDVPSKRSWVASMTSILVASGISSTISVLPSHAVENNAPQTQVFGKTAVDGEANRVFMKARQIESDGDEVQAAKLYQQVVQAEPEFIYGWSNLGNVLSATGNLQQSLLCYKKAILLHPPKDMLSVILINKASVENALDHLDIAVNDLTVAESLAGPSQIILSNKATILSKAGNWKESCEIFEKIISSADRYALPWWLRYSMALLETDRGMVSYTDD